MKRRKPMPLKQAIQELEKTAVLPPNVENEWLTSDISMNEQVLREVFRNCSDVVFRQIISHGEIRMLLVYVDGLIDTKMLEQVVLKPLLFEGMPDGFEKVQSVSQIVQEQLIAIAETKAVHKVSEVVEGVLKAHLAILTQGESLALIADLKGFEKRAVEEPSAEIAVRGPRDGFTETLRVNTTLVRRRIRSPKLKMEALTVGKLSQTDIVIAYVEGVVQDSILNEVRERVQRIQIDSILESGYIEEFIEDHPYSPFPTIQNTERPDAVSASLLEGKVAIFVDNTPFVLILPFTFWSGLQAVEDYYERFGYATFIRFIRLVLFNMALFFPSLFVAATTFHPQLIPTNLLISIAAAREGVPFPAVVETFLMEFMFEGLREAGIRLPKPVGSAVSIVGALVIGEAAVQAGIISAPVVIIVSTTGIASFAIPRYNLGIAYRMLRFPLLLMAGMMGLYGVAIFALMIFVHLVNMRSFGVPYLTPMAPQIPGNLKDVLWRSPRWTMTHRPALISGGDKKRIPEGQKPSPKRGKNIR